MRVWRLLSRPNVGRREEYALLRVAPEITGRDNAEHARSLQEMRQDVMDLLGHSSTLIVTIIIIGALAYLGAVAFQPARPAPRIIAGYVCGGTMLAIGLAGLYFGASFEAPLILEGAYVFNPLRMEWIAVGLLAVLVGFLLVRQAIRRQ